MSSPDVPASTEFPEYMDFFALAETEPEKALTLLVWLFMDEEVARNRVQFLTANPALQNLLSVDECQREIQLIKTYGLHRAVKDHGLEIQMACRMASTPETVIATYEAFTEHTLAIADE